MKWIYFDVFDSYRAVIDHAGLAIEIEVNYLCVRGRLNIKKSLANRRTIGNL
jgi:hypothetical protein